MEAKGFIFVFYFGSARVSWRRNAWIDFFKKGKRVRRGRETRIFVIIGGRIIMMIIFLNYKDIFHFK